MPKNFLIGNFLPAYGSSFGKITSKPKRGTGMAPDELADRFSRRKNRLRLRRRQYVTLLLCSMVTALAVTIGVFHVNLRTGPVGDIQISQQEVVQMEEIVQTQQIEKPPPPPRPPVPVEVPDDVELADEDLDFDATLDLDAAVTDLPPPPPAAVADEAEPEPEIFVAVEEPPTMVGGMTALLKDLQYPELARRAALEGTVVVRIVVSDRGEPSDPFILRSVSEVLDKEAIRAVMLQKFVPGKQRGRPVSVYMAIPVIFRLQ